jgi:DNA-binding MarR family transcriptional regulator
VEKGSVEKRSDDPRMAAWTTFLTAHAAVIERLEEELQTEQSLPLGWYEVLLHLSWAPDGRLRMGELAASVLLTPSGLTRLVDRMNAAGLVRREACPSDRRVAYATLTAAGRQRLRRAAPTHLRGVEEHFLRHLSDAEAATLAGALSRVLDAVCPAGRRPRRGAGSPA